MIRLRHLLVLLAAVLVAGTVTPAMAGQPSETMTVRGLGEVMIYAPASPPTQVVLFLSGDGGWNPDVVSMAEPLRDHGALVAGIDVRRLVATLEAGDRCAYPAGLLENLARQVELHQKLPHYVRPLLAGYSLGATLAYAAIAAAPPETFIGALSLGFSPDVEMARPLCQQRALSTVRRSNGTGDQLRPDHTLQVPWFVLQGENDRASSPAAARAFVSEVPSGRFISLPKVGHGYSVPRHWEPQFLQAFDELASHTAPPMQVEAPAVRDLPLTEVPATGAPIDHPHTFAVILTGDGGWADIDKSIAAGLAARGIPSVGWSSLAYYWTPRTPNGAASDLARILRHYAMAWQADRVLLVGYSFGADVLPFLVNRLPSDVAPLLGPVAMLGVSSSAAFEFTVAGWVGASSAPRYPTAPEIERLRVPGVCVVGAGDADAPCPANGSVTTVVVGHGHHFGGDYTRLVSTILDRR